MSKTTNFIDKLLLDIQKQKTINTNSSLFIQYKKLKKHNLKKINEDYLPMEAVLGDIFLIKNNSIIECYSYINTENIDIRFNRINRNYKSIITMYNINVDDIGMFNNTSIFNNKEDIVSRDITRTMDFIILLLKNEFCLYVK